MRKITEIPATIFKLSKGINRQYRVAAYCRVSTEKEEQELLKNILKRKGFLNENEEMTEEDFNKLIEFAKANKNFIMREK